MMNDILKNKLHNNPIQIFFDWNEWLYNWQLISLVDAEKNI